MIHVQCIGQGQVDIAEKSGGKGNYTSTMKSSFGLAFLSKRARDLMRVGQATFLADRAFRRSGRLGQQVRHMTVVVPVEEPELWTTAASDVAKLASFVSHDHWKFEFTMLPTKQPETSSSKVNLRNPSICLLSDGLDSLCGAAATIKTGDTPIFVTHSPPGFESVRKRIQHLVENLGQTDEQAYFVNFGFTASDRDETGRRCLFPERSRRTRPFLYLAMAGAVALELQIPQVLLNENGVLAINLPFQPHIIGAQISRHAHPETLRRFQGLLKTLWSYESEPVVRNRLWDYTKGEEIAEYLDTASDLATETLSCENSRQQVARLKAWLREKGYPFKGARECGLCMPCLVRRSAMHYASIDENAEHYVFDARRAFHDPKAYADWPLYASLAHNVRDVFDFCERIRHMPPSEFVLTYISQLGSLLGPEEDISQIARQVYALCTRFASQFIDFICI